ncbi:MAG: hypothetical protein LAP61_05715 [Acidobacteriia bacterium]|nr:hypothetical protein [Terriglobia bacterium]
MADTNLSDLDPLLQTVYPKWVDGCAEEFEQQDLNGSVRIIQGWRSPSYQDHLESTGVSKLGSSQSLHCCTIAGKPASRAFDFGVFAEDGSYVTDGNDPRYAAAGAVAESLGLVWGGRFVHPGADPDHIQLPDSEQ